MVNFTKSLKTALKF